jgi:hypothetical protein
MIVRIVSRSVGFEWQKESALWKAHESNTSRPKEHDTFRHEPVESENLANF